MAAKTTTQCIGCDKKATTGMRECNGCRTERMAAEERDRRERESIRLELFAVGIM